VYRAYFVDGCNIARPQALAELAAAVGLDAEQARRVLAGQRYADAVAADWQRARDAQVHAVPTFQYRQRTLVGFAAYPELRRLIAG
jgi:predicted DsbA family dithiol-disulfide isomerase